MPLTVPRPSKLAGLLGPSVVAPSWMRPVPVSEPARLAISLCMQCGNVPPAPTTNVVPQPLAPRAKFSCCWANAANWPLPAVLLVERVGDVEAERVRGGVAAAQLRAEPERVTAGLALAQPQLRGQVGQQRAAGHEPGPRPPPGPACCRARSSSASPSAPLS